VNRRQFLGTIAAAAVIAPQLPAAVAPAPPLLAPPAIVVPPTIRYAHMTYSVGFVLKEEAVYDELLLMQRIMGELGQRAREHHDALLRQMFTFQRACEPLPEYMRCDVLWEME